MPGGSAYEIQDNLGASGKAKLTNFLDKQGNYVGICAGGYYAARGYFWKGDDGAPTDTCKNQFCRYGVQGTFSYDAATSGFTAHEWNGTSYHSNLLAYSPLANVYVEGPIEEIAGPWHADSNPNHPYDSHLIFTDDALKQSLGVIYWGGAQKTMSTPRILRGGANLQTTPTSCGTRSTITILISLRTANYGR